MNGRQSSDFRLSICREANLTRELQRHSDAWSQRVEVPGKPVSFHECSGVDVSARRIACAQMVVASDETSPSRFV